MRITFHDNKKPDESLLFTCTFVGAASGSEKNNSVLVFNSFYKVI